MSEVVALSQTAEESWGAGLYRPFTVAEAVLLLRQYINAGKPLSDGDIQFALELLDIAATRPDVAQEGGAS